MKRIVMLALTLPVFLVGCGAQAQDGTEKFTDDDGVHGVIPESSNYVKKIEVDGTTCIIFSDAAITCDWDSTPSQEPTTDPLY